jgi:hypothetical protein
VAESPVHRRTYLKGVGVASALSGLALSGASPVSASTTGYGDGGYGELGYGGVSGEYDDEEPAELTVLVEDDGEVLEGVDITIEDGEETVATARTDADGETTVELAAGVYDLRASKDGYGTHAEEVELTDGETTSRDIELEPEPGVLDLKVSDEGSEPIVDADVTVYDDGSTVAAGRTDPDGCFEVELDEGTYEVRVSKDGYEARTKEDVEMARGETNVVSIELEEVSETAHLTVEAVDGDGDGIGDVVVDVEDEDGQSVATAETDAEGLATFELDSGEYTVVARDYDSDDETSETIELETGDEETLTFELESGDPELSVYTGSADDVSDTEATLRGEVDFEGIDEATVHFEYRTIGRSYWEWTGTTTKTSEGDFEERVSGLSTGTDYEFRAVAETGDGGLEEIGEIRSFTTERSRARPGIDRLSVDTTDTPNPHAYIDIEWAVSHRDGGLDTVEIEVEATDGSATETERESVSGETASGDDTIRVLHGENATYDVTLTVSSTNDERASVTETIDA